MSLEHGFKLISKEHNEALNGDAYEYRHEKSGAKLVLIKNDDRNKVFIIGFRTPSNNSTGVAHIMEHSTLCGSEKYPVKEPFVELAKGSVNTFLNAMTYSDRTVYPIATTNDKDYRNLMDVYMDAVLNPKIYDSPYTFMQEGWHYHLEEPDKPIEYNGVVYNEMKGVYSDPDSLMEREIYKALYPDTIYSQESGGYPANIPDLTYEQFLDFHKKFYHPSNSYIYLYGDIDIDEQLEYLDGWLKDYDAVEVDADIPVQEPLKERVEADFPYPVTPGESLEGKDRLALSFGLWPNMSLLDENIVILLVDYLLARNSSVLKKALLDKGLAGDVSVFADRSIKQPSIHIMLKDTKLENKEAFVETVNEVISDLVENGMDREELESFLNISEFKTMEAYAGESSDMPKGLGIGLAIYNNWLYGEKPFEILEIDKIYKQIREMIGTGELEKYLKKVFLDNPSQTLIGLYPDTELAQKQVEELAKKLDDYKKSLSKEEIDELVAQTQELIRRQNRVDTPEELATIPRLSVSEIERKNQDIVSEELDLDGVPVIYVEGGKTDIVYLDLDFSLEALDVEDLDYLPILQDILSSVSTQGYEYDVLNREIDKYMGGFDILLQIYEENKTHDVYSCCNVRAKMLLEFLPQSVKLIEEVLTKSLFEQKEVIRGIVKESRLETKAEIQSRGNMLATMRAGSQYSDRARLTEKLMGIESYETIKNLDENFDERWDTLSRRLAEILDKLINRNGLIIGIACRRENLDKVLDEVKPLVEKFKAEDLTGKSFKLPPIKKNEAFITPGSVMYNVKGGRTDFGEDFNFGALKVLKTILSMDYLWNKIRVLGGAYGAGLSMNRNGDIYFSTFRDPNLEKSYENFDGVVEYIENLDLTPEEVDKYIIGTISPMEVPLTAPRKMRIAMGRLHTGKTNEDAQQSREEVLDTSLEDLKKNASIIKEILEEDNVCTIGTESAIQSNKDLFDEVEYIQ